MMRLFVIGIIAICATLTNAHLAAWHKGMYCLNGVDGVVNLNANEAVNPLYDLPKKDWWFHHINKCDNFPPDEGDFLELPAGGDFTVEISANRATTSLSYNGKYATDWPDGKTYPEDYNVPSCITTPNMHTQNQSMAAGTAFAISYQSDIKKVTAENLAVFTVRYHTPWKRIASYSVPAAMPACPPEGCICAWGWIPNGCGQPNMYHQAFKCKVTGATATAPIAAPKPPVWCEDDPARCTKGAKQMIYWNQRDGNNIAVSGLDRSGFPKSPAYNNKCGFPDGAQNDIFAAPANGGGSNTPPTPPSNPSSGSGSNTGPASSKPAPSQGSSGSDTGSGPSKPAPSSGFPDPDADNDSNTDPTSPYVPPPRTCKGRSRKRAAGR
ncbi:hypothetical protein BDZ94DRAFT_1255898, partial [Collybia nuda]